MINLFVNNTLVDLSEDFDLLITRSIADIKNPEQRSSDWSKTAKIPGTKTNNILFGGIFEVEHTVLGSGQFAPNFNPNKKADVVVLVDGFEQLRGFIRLIQINVLDHDFIEYECSLHGQTADLFTTLGNAKLSELNFDEYNHVLTSTNVTNSWDTSIIKNGSSQAFAYGEGYVYAQMLNKYGSQNTNTNQWRVDDHIPCLYAKTIIDKIMSNIGYQYTSDSFFTTDRFKRLIIPYTNFGFTADETALQTRLFQAQLSTSQTIIRTAGAITATTLPFNNDSTGGNFDNGGNYNTSTYQYTAPISGTFDFFLSLQSSFDGTAPYSSYASMSFFVYKNGVVVKTIDIDSNNVSTTHWDFDGIGSCQISCVVGDTIQIKFIQTWFDGVSPILGTNTINSTTQFYNHVSASTLAYNNPLDFGLFFSGDFTQKDLLINFVKMFNLYIEQDMDNAKKLRFVPRDDFYNGTTQDWTSLVDYSQNVQIVPMGDLEANPYIFTYKEGEDFYNKEYKQSTSKIYGDRIVRVDNDFVKQEKKIEITFSPTMLLASGNRYYSTILNGNNDKGQLRCLYFGGVKNTSAYEVYNTTLTNVPNFSKYPLTLHIDDTDNMQFDLNFGMSNYILADKGLEFSNQNLVNVYWYKTIKEITDKNSKVFKGYFRINPYTWANIQFKDLYFFEGQYWRLQTVTDYNPLIDDVYECEFLLAKYYPPFSRTKKQLGFGDVVDTGGGAELIPFGNKTNSTGSSTRGVYVGNNTGRGGENVVVGNLNAIGGSHNVVTSSERVVIPDNYENVTAIRCNEYNVPYTERLYIENYPCLGSWMSGGKVTSITDADSPYLATSEDWLILCDTDNASITVTLPTPTAANSGKMYTIKKTQSSHSVTINAGDGSVLLDDNTTLTRNAKNSFDQVVSDGTQYWVITN